MYARVKQFTLERPLLKKSVAVLFVIIGFLALITPLTPGAFLLLVGLELLGYRLLFTDKLLSKLRGSRAVSTEGPGIK